MKIEIVHLENIRSHVKSTVPFARGFNCLVGGLGCGKSSILYSVDFAFFGDPLGRSYEYLLREDAESGRVVVQFVQNGKSYKMSRCLRRHGKGISQDTNELELFEDENLIASLKADAVAEQLKAITGLDRELFREIVWVRQEHLKELLDTRPRERQGRLDSLFGLSDYEVAWGNIAIYQRDYENEKRFCEKDPDVAGIGKLGEDYNKVAEEFSIVEIELEDATRKVSAAKRTLEEADLKLKRLDETRTLVDEHKRKEVHVQARLDSAKYAASRLARRVADKRAAIEKYRQLLSALDAQKALHSIQLKEVGIDPNQPINIVRQCVSSFDDQLARLIGKQEGAQKAVQECERRLFSLSAENRCPLCFQELTETYKKELIQRIQQEHDDHQKSISQVEHEIQKCRRTRDKANVAFSDLQTLLARIEDSNSHLTEESEALADLSEELEEGKRLEQELVAQLEAVRSEIGRFTLSELNTAKSQREQVFREYYLLESDFNARESRKRDLESRLDDIRERIDQAQRKIERMEKTVKLGEIISSMRDAYRNIQPKLRSEFVKILRTFVQQVLDDLVGSEGPLLNVLIDDTYTPYVRSEAGFEREVANLSGGERTLLAFAYRLGLGQLIMHSRTGHGLSMLLLDEPTESLGSEDGSIGRLAEAISRLKAIEQIIAVTHSDDFAEKADHVIRLEKEAGVSRVTVER